MNPNSQDTMMKEIEEDKGSQVHGLEEFMLLKWTQNGRLLLWYFVKNIFFAKKICHMKNKRFIIAKNLEKEQNEKYTS